MNNFHWSVFCWIVETVGGGTWFSSVFEWCDCCNQGLSMKLLDFLFLSVSVLDHCGCVCLLLLTKTVYKYPAVAFMCAGEEIWLEKVSFWQWSSEDLQPLSQAVSLDGADDEKTSDRSYLSFYHSVFSCTFCWKCRKADAPCLDNVRCNWFDFHKTLVSLLRLLFIDHRRLHIYSLLFWCCMFWNAKC